MFSFSFSSSGFEQEQESTGEISSYISVLILIAINVMISWVVWEKSLSGNHAVLFSHSQEVDALLSENTMLQGKLHSQEDDFRLQNSTLMQELSKVLSTNTIFNPCHDQEHVNPVTLCTSILEIKRHTVSMQGSIYTKIENFWINTIL